MRLASLTLLSSCQLNVPCKQSAAASLTNYTIYILIKLQRKLLVRLDRLSRAGFDLRCSLLVTQNVRSQEYRSASESSRFG
jgi:hypothetical protein